MQTLTKLKEEFYGSKTGSTSFWRELYCRYALPAVCSSYLSYLMIEIYYKYEYKHTLRF